MRKRWKIGKLTDKAKFIAKKSSLNPIIVQILINRNIEENDFSDFLNNKGHFYSPLLLPDMKIALERIKRAIKDRERICLFGDYDVDGITSLVIFYDYIKETGVEFSFYIPHRLKEGFGLNREAIKKIKEEGTSLVICFDCGTNSNDEVNLARSLGMDMIIVDHHFPKEGVNTPLAFINPKRRDSSYPFSFLTSASLAFKLVQALKDNDCLHLLDLVALSLVCDVAPLIGENRNLLKEGLKLLREAKRPCIDILCKSSGIKSENIDTFHLGYILGPRINASGRVNTAKDSLEMFINPDKNRLEEYVKRLEEHNRLRKEIEKRILEEAEEDISRYIKDYPTIVVYREGWHQGILGIVASRLVERYYRPAFVFGFQNERGKGSARSIANFNLMEALNYCSQYLTTYGGHTQAAGIEIVYKNIEEFKNKLNEVAGKFLSPQDYLPCLDIDLEVELTDINLDLVKSIDNLKPFGEGNPQPLFVTRGVFVKQPCKKNSNGIYSVWLSKNELTYEGIFFENNGLVDILNYGKFVDIVYSLERNYYYDSVRLVLRDVRLS
ncbi:MAG: single-stranded-DNA-specific exonuclease RecJ [Candidatus Omnitrophica bacterium]|nr:single-stranded-DNA-specific exonuclease RecJ [Candidatus Omnitrophota bacterium]